MGLNQGRNETIGLDGGDFQGDEIAGTSERAQATLGVLGQKQIKAIWERDAFLVAYNAAGVSRFYTIPYSNHGLRTANWNAQVLRHFGRKLTEHESILHRPVAQNEIEAYAESAQTVQSSITVSKILTAQGAGVVAYRSRSTFRFPLYTPKDPSRFSSFPARQLPLVRGTAAKYMSHLLYRYPAFFLFSWWFLAPFAAAVGQLRQDAQLKQDPRVADAYKTVSGIRLDQKKAEMGIQSEERRHIGPNDRIETPRYTDRNDDGSSIGDDRATDPLSDGVGSRDDALPGFGRTPNTGFDEDSPSGGRGMESASPSYDTSSTSSSGAWDRVRSRSAGVDQQALWGSDEPERAADQEASSPKSSVWKYGSRGRDENESSSDGFSFGKGTQEKEMAKEKAQKDFDRMLEAEREGGQDGKGTSTGSYWGK
ncbi:MAG: hypothetical protein Q9227_005847 [Pyrenula ochraceoflavens]